MAPYKADCGINPVIIKYNESIVVSLREGKKRKKEIREKRRRNPHIGWYQAFSSAITGKK